MTKMKEYLLKNIGFHLEDLSLPRQLELEAIKNELKLSDDWVLLALSKDSLEKWEEWGFALFRKNEFKRNIDIILNTLKRIPDDKLDKEMNKGKPEFRGYDVIDLNLTKKEFIEKFKKDLAYNSPVGENHFLLHFPPAIGEIRPTLYNCYITDPDTDPDSSELVKLKEKVGLL